MEAKDIVHWCYLIKQNEDGSFFCKFQFDEQFKGDVEDVKEEMILVRLHTEKTGSQSKVQYQKRLIDLHGTFNQSFGKELERLTLNRIKNKPKNYV